MPRIPRSFYSGNFFHVITQGIKKEYIFQNSHYKEKYLNILFNKLDETNIKLIAYCVMDNHVHHLMYTPDINSISNLMQSVNTSYAVYYNKSENRVGYVFRNRFLSEPILNQKHLFSCLSYIHNNPVKANIVSHPQKYKYSSYSQYVKKIGIVNNDILELLFGNANNYLEVFFKIHNIKDSNFLDSDIFIFSRCQNIIESFLNCNNLSLLELRQMPELLNKLVLELHMQENLSERSIAKLLKISRYLVHKMLNYHN